jgi:hypothetical protein
MRAKDADNAYLVNIPAKRINFTVGAVVPNTPPEKPQIEPLPTNNKTTGSDQKFKIKSEDDDEDKIKYEIDWNNNGIADNQMTSLSRESVTVAKKWTTAGSKSFRARAIDETGAMSSWSDETIVIVNPVPSVVVVPGSCKVSIGQSTCTGRLEWEFDNAIAPYSIRNTATGIVVSTAVTNILNNVSYKLGVNRISFIADGDVLEYVDINITCVAGATPSAGKCVALNPVGPTGSSTNTVVTPNINLSLDKSVIRSGETATVSWTISNVANMDNINCKLIGAGIDMDIESSSGHEDTSPVANTSVIQMTCSGTGFTTVSAEARIEIIPVVKEV